MNYIHSMILNGTENPSSKHISWRLVIVRYKMKTRGPWVTTLTWGRFLNVFNIILKFHYNLPLEADAALHLNKFDSPSPKEAVANVWLKLAQWFRKRRFLNIFNVILQFPYHPPWKRAVFFIWINLNPFQPKMLCAIFDWNWLSDSEMEDEMRNVYDNTVANDNSGHWTMVKFWSE